MSNSGAMTPLKLIALDAEDLSVVSCHVQDAVLRMADMTYVPSQQRFAALLNRFDWEGVAEGHKEFARRRAALRFDRVRGAQLKRLKPGSSGRVLSLLAVSFETTDPPGGYVTLTFSGGASIRLEVECIEAELKDLGPAWRTKHAPRHPDGESGARGS
jgi:hypothetical protein